jgi:Beta-ketoacyl synthase, N-terminal domain
MLSFSRFFAPCGHHTGHSGCRYWHGGRLPGGIDSPERLWEALLRGNDLVTEIPPDRWDADEYYDPEPGVPGRSGLLPTIVTRLERAPSEYLRCNIN